MKRRVRSTCSRPALSRDAEIERANLSRCQTRPLIKYNGHTVPGRRRTPDPANTMADYETTLDGRSRRVPRVRVRTTL